MVELKQTGVSIHLILVGIFAVTMWSLSQAKNGEFHRLTSCMQKKERNYLRKLEAVGKEGALYDSFHGSVFNYCLFWG